jgi:hypothetical protein
MHGAVRVLEAARLRQPLSFAYSVLRDVQYFAALGRGLTRKGSGDQHPSAPLRS